MRVDIESIIESHAGVPTSAAPTVPTLMPKPPAPDEIDGHLLRVLVVLVDERSVSRAARRLGQTQPAISATLKRLRSLFGDPLLVRERLEMLPTERALALAAQARLALDAIGALTAAPAGFDPGTARQTFRIASPDYLAPALLASVAERLRLEAPNARLELHPMGAAFAAERELADDRLDVAIGNWPAPPERLHTTLLFEDALVCLMRHGHPLADGALTDARYLEAQHVAPMRYSSAQLGVVETHLAATRRTRDTPVAVPYFSLAPHVVARTDLIFTTARHFAEPFVAPLGLALRAAPPDFPSMRFYLLWHERAHHAPAHRWLRGEIVRVARAFMAERAEVATDSPSAGS